VAEFEFMRATIVTWRGFQYAAVSCLAGTITGVTVDFRSRHPGASENGFLYELNSARLLRQHVRVPAGGNDLPGQGAELYCNEPDGIAGEF
jgi:hypothetical protein